MIFQNIFEPVRKVDAPEELRPETELPPLEMPEPNFFDGMGDTWKAIPNAVLDTASSAITGLRQIPLENFTTQPEVREWVRRQREEVMPENARRIREIAKQEYELDPQTSGTAAQIVYGLGEMIPKAVLYGSVAGPAGGALLFGADVGVNCTQTLLDEGVDEQTAINAGMLTFATNAIGLKLPAAFATGSRLTSAAIGAGANVGLNVAEVQGVHWILENQNYDELAKNYELNFADNAVAAGLGAAFGAAFWRPTTRVRFEQERKALSERFAIELERTGKFTPQQVTAQANLNASVVTSAASRWGLTPEQVSSVAPRVRIAETTNQSDLNQIIGIEGAENLRESGADIDYIAVAESMRAQGKTPQEIRLATGWEQGADGKWRYEIPDFKFKDGWDSAVRDARSRLDSEYAKRQENVSDDSEFLALEEQLAAEKRNLIVSRNLSEIVDAPELFSAYPQLKDLTVEFGPLPDRVGGYFSEDRNVIRLPLDSAISSKQARSTLVHEVQHAVQRIEGFTRGSNPEAFPLKSFALWRDMERLRELRRSDAWKEYKQKNDAIDPFEASDEQWAEITALENNPDVAAVLAEVERLRNKWGFSETVVRAINSDEWDPFSSTGRELDDSDPDYRVRQYRNVAGEVEARNVQSRLDLSDEERRTRLLSETEDVPRELQTTNVSSRYSASYSPDDVAKAKPLVKRIVDRVFNGESSNGKGRSSFEDYLAVTDEAARVIQEKTGLDVRGYIHTILDSNVSHVNRRHGPGKETRQDQKPFLRSDFERLPEVLSSPENIFSGEEAGTIVFTKTFDDGEIYVVEVTRRPNKKHKGRGKLELKTAYKKILSEPNALAKTSPLAERPKRPETASSVEQSIANRAQNVNNWVDESFEPDADLIERAVENFGLTNDVREAFYVLPDGRMLDGSGRHWGGDERDVAGQRQVDHSDISEVIDDASGANAMYEWMGRTGAMRFDQIVGIASVARPPTKAQLDVLNRANRGKYLALSLNTPEGRIVDDVEFESASKAKIQDFFDQALEKARRGEVGAFAQENRGSFSPTENRITLTPNANVSTFSHEIGHWYLHNLMLASQFEEAAGNVKQDVDVLLKAFGINSVDDWNALGVNGQRKYHERFASWVEQYLSEGKSPSPSLVSFFKRFAEWLKDVYEHFSDAVGGRYQAEFGEELPPLSAEVRKVLDRMYTDEFGSKTVRPDKTQVAAARAVQAEETNREKRNRILATDSEDDYSKAVAAQRKAASDLNSGTPVDVSQQMCGAPLNEQVLGAEQKKFAREVMSGDGRTAVVLQNRDRSNVVSVGQMNSIASDPQYGLLSFSRNTASGAPIVSYGTLPDDAYLGVRDYVIDSGEQVPVQYAVVEADTVQTSNRFDGSQNPSYGDASLMNVVAGNGRLTGLTEAYRRGTAQQYRDALMSDTQHGVEPAVIASMQHPVLVRYMPQEKVSTGFVSRSNSDQVMARSNVEIAAEDAPRIRENASLYRFDEEGMPTAETVRQFLIDIGEPNALGRLINSNGNPTPEAIRRIQTAVFHEAYQNDVLTELFSSTTDANIKRILTAMAAFAPRIIEMRNSGIDLAQGIVEAANAVRMAREEGRSLQDLVSQLSFLDDPTTTPFIELLARNANSAAAIGRVLEPLADWTVNAMRAADGGLFGDENVVRTDVADVLGQMRRIENEQRVAAGQEPLPELDVAAIRASIQNLQSQLDEIAAQAPDTAQAEPNPQQVQATVREGIANDPDAIRMQELASQQPEQTFMFEDEDGQTIEMRFDEVETRMQEIENEGKTEASGIAQAAICIMRNDGAQ
ncbi:MAG: hypothetical protein Q3X95_03435 [Duodenibacillus sp.]|nr:hypothetical protein [Duodenibacillus sp.]